ncbi:MAG: RagB/SusD family nutrient uptake outer membrane protein [Bacteroidales bacterium]
MRNLFRTNILGALVTGALLTTSCSDYLDKMPENQLPVDEVDYTITSNAYKPVMGIYHLTGQKLTAWATLGMMAVRGDDTEKGGIANDQIDYSYFHNFNYSTATNFWGNNNTWVAFYNVIISSNLALGSLDKYAQYASSETDRIVIEGYKYEVRFQRAYAYLLLSRMYGSVPVFTDNSSSDAYIKKPYKEVIDFIVSEAEACAEGLAAVHPANMKHKGAASRYSALALKAVAAAELCDYPTVLEATTPIIEEGKFDLHPDYYALFNMGGEYSQENLFEIQFSFFGQESGDQFRADNFFEFQGPGAGAYFKSAKKFGEGNRDNMGGGWGFLPVNKKLSDLMIARGEGIRYTTTVIKTTGMTDAEGKEFNITPSNDTIYAGNPGTPTEYNGKAYTPSIELIRNQYGGDKNIIVFRYADILLLDAEAKVKQGMNGDESFNKVRRRAGMPELTNVTFEQVMEERYVELGCEFGTRYYDLVRTGLAKTELSAQGEGYTEAKRFYPIPQAQIDLNPNLGL